MISRKLIARARLCRVGFSPLEIVQKDECLEGFHFSPSYTRLASYDPVQNTFSKHTFAVNKALLVDQIMVEFWENIRHNGMYILDEEFRQFVDPLVHRHLEAGISDDQMENFKSKKWDRLKFYLEGTAGVVSCGYSD